MIYLDSFYYPSYDEEYAFRLNKVKRTCYNTMYPFFTLSAHGMTELRFEPITVLYGGNGCGKTTALNVIAEKLRLNRDTLYNRSSFFENYVDMCYCDIKKPVPSSSRIITSDDVFDFMLNVRSINSGVDLKRDALTDEYLESKYSHFSLNSLDDYEKLKTVNAARSKTRSRFIRERLQTNVREHSNGESAYMYFTDKIRENALYLLDEPENSLSPERQLELMKYIENAVRFYGCQIILSTHSPFLLSLRFAKIYDIDGEQTTVKKWTELKNVRAYYEFFKAHEKEFE